MSFVSSAFRGASRFGQGAALDDGALMSLAPSIFASEPHSSRSARYTYIPTADVITGMRSQGFVPVKAFQGNSRIEGKANFTKHMVRFRHADYIGTEKAGDVVPEVVLVNSHDGTSQYHLMSGIFRIRCLNGMIVCESTTADVKVRHSGQVVDNVIEGAFTVIDESKAAIERATQWQGVTLRREEKMALATAAHVLRFGDSEGNTDTPFEPSQLLGARRSDDRGDSLWLTHNVIQENVIKGGLQAWTRDDKGRPRRAAMREIKNIDGDVKLNRALWMLSEQMAKLKAA